VSAILTFAEDLDKVNGVAGRSVGDLGHVMPHEHKPPATGSFEILGSGGVGNVGGIEAGPLVGDGDFEAIIVEVIADANGAGAIHLVAMLDGVYQGLFESEFDAKNVAIGGMPSPQELFDAILDDAGFGRVTGYDNVREDRFAIVRIGIHRYRES
jgi:hypothetical protein